MPPLSNCSYNKIKLLHNFSKMLWFIEHHGLPDAQKAGDQQCKQFMEFMVKDLTDHIEKLKAMLDIDQQ